MYRIPELKNFKEIFHIFSTSEDGNMSLSLGHKSVSPQKVITNRKKFFKNMGIDINKTMMIWLQHGDNVIEASEKWLGKTILNETDPPKADAVITNKKNTFLTLTVADCVPVIIYDPVNSAVGLVHAGWKGVDKKIVLKTIKKMSEKYNSDPKVKIVGIGPCVGKESYIKSNFPDQKKKDWGKFTQDLGHGLCSIDLVGNILNQLKSVGVKENNIFISGIDTTEDERFFSYYVDVQSEKGDRGRMFCVVGLTD